MRENDKIEETSPSTLQEEVIRGFSYQICSFAKINTANINFAKIKMLLVFFEFVENPYQSLSKTISATFVGLVDVFGVFAYKLA